MAQPINPINDHVIKLINQDTRTWHVRHNTQSVIRALNTTQ